MVIFVAVYNTQQCTYVRLQGKLQACLNILHENRAIHKILYENHYMPLLLKFQ